MKSYIEDCVVGVYGSLLKDFLHVHPSMSNELGRLNRLSTIVSSRGLSFMTITLPDCCKYLERGLASGRLEDTRPPYHGRKSASDARPTFLWGLWSMVFDKHGTLRDDASHEAIAALRQLYLFAKKLRLDCEQDRVDQALVDFCKLDESLPRSHSQTWDDDVPVWERRENHPIWGVAQQPLLDQYPLIFGEDWSRTDDEPSFRWDAFRKLCAKVTLSLGEFDVWALRPKHGPGAVSDLMKVKHELSHWPAKLQGVFPADWFASTDLVDRTLSTREFPSKVLAVPKTQKGPRIIAAEPTAHQWCQGGIQRWFTERLGKSLLRSSVSLHDQTASRQLALEASITGDLATVDLSAASDRISTRLVEYVFQTNHHLLDALHATRTRLYHMPDGETHVLRKFACMGSACTFPVQTIIFACISMFAIMVQEDDYDVSHSRLLDVAKRVRVFGDDIILPSNAYDVLCKLLTELGLKVNTNKSFGSGFFRESCGMDAYKGTDVTPAYFLQPYNARNPESLASVVQASNNFYKKMLWNTADYIAKTVDPEVLKLLRVANKDVSQPYLFSYVDGPTNLKVRWNSSKQVHEVRQLLLQTKQKVLKGSGNASLLQFFTEEPDPMFPYESGQQMRPVSRIASGWVSLDE